MRTSITISASLASSHNIYCTGYDASHDLKPPEQRWNKAEGTSLGAGQDGSSGEYNFVISAP